MPSKYQCNADKFGLAITKALVPAFFYQRTLLLDFIDINTGVGFITEVNLLNKIIYNKKVT